MGLLRASYKLIFSFFAILFFFIIAIVINIILFPSDFYKRKILTKLSAAVSKFMLKILGFHLDLQGPPPSNNGTLVIGNHMSYLDILIYLSFFECLFVTSVETKEKPFLGHITRLAGCLFVERRNPRNLPNELKTIKKYFDNDISVCIFPEGTSSNGLTILPFKKSLFQLPLETKCPIQPIILKYDRINGENFSDKNCDLVCWYGEMGFFKHLYTLCTLRKIEASIKVLPQIDSNQFDNRKEIAAYCYKVLTENHS